MLLLLGFIIVLASTIGGFMVAGGKPILLLHVSEFIVIGGIALGVVVVSSPGKVLKKIGQQVMESFGTSGVKSHEFLELLKLMYELFLLGRRNGLIALDEHVSEPTKSTILGKYPTFIKNKERVEFLCNGLRPIIDGKIKPDQLPELLSNEIQTMRDEAEGPSIVLHLVADSLPGIGIVAAVLGIINTMASIADGPERVGEKVAAALTGTFLGILLSYGFVGPLAQRIHFSEEAQFLYYTVMAKALAGFAKGLAPIMAIEVARRSLGTAMKLGADELEATLKSTNAPA